MLETQLSSRHLVDKAINLIKNAKHLTNEDIEAAYISVKQVTDTLTREAIKAYSSNVIIVTISYFYAFDIKTLLICKRIKEVINFFFDLSITCSNYSDSVYNCHYYSFTERVLKNEALKCEIKSIENIGNIDDSMKAVLVIYAIIIHLQSYEINISACTKSRIAWSSWIVSLSILILVNCKDLCCI